MSNQALYRKWRAQTFDGILGQDHITRTLRNQLRAGKLGHAYLFAGVRGTGKTSTARILAKAANCIGDTDDPPCNACPICRTISEGTSLDLIEIDAASNRGIDEIRDLRERVNFMPHECRYKVYVIDEVHMLTNEAFNALLKTLEEPPEHVIFILCTTEPHRLPDTILSRCQRFDFRRATQDVVREKLAFICEREGLQVADDALAYLARRGAGSFRDAESLLDQVAAYGGGDISLELVQAVLGAVPYRLVLGITEAVVIGDVTAGFRAIAAAFAAGADARQLVSSLVEQMRGVLLMRIGTSLDTLLVSDEEAQDIAELTQRPEFSLRRLVQGIRSFGEASDALRTAARPEIPLELALVETIMTTTEGAEPEVRPERQAESAKPQRRTPPRATEQAEPTAGDAKGVAEAPVVETSPRTVEQPVIEDGTTAPDEPAQEPVAEQMSADQPATESNEPHATPETQTLSLDAVQGNWQRIVARMRAQSPNLQAVLRGVFPVAVANDLITMACESAFHRDRLSDEKRRALVEQVMSDILGANCRIECVVDHEARAQGQDSAAEPSGDLFTRVDSEAARRKELLEHPAVKELTQRGGKVRRVELNPDEPKA